MATNSFQLKAVVTPDGGAPGNIALGSQVVPAGQELKITDLWASVPGGVVVQAEIAATLDWEYRVPTGALDTPGQAALTLDKPYIVDGGVTVDFFTNQIDGTWPANGFVALTGTLAPKGEA